MIKRLSYSHVKYHETFAPLKTQTNLGVDARPGRVDAKSGGVDAFYLYYMVAEYIIPT
jgi:hypothetical protein